jgi:hypothetical protein
LQFAVLLSSQNKIARQFLILSRIHEELKIRPKGGFYSSGQAPMEIPKNKIQVPKGLARAWDL